MTTLLARARALSAPRMLGLSTVLGLLIGAALMRPLWHPNVPLWLLWAPLALLLAGSAGASSAFGILSLLRLDESYALAWKPLVRTTLFVVVLMLAAVNATILLPDTDYTGPNNLLISWTVIAGSPMALAMLAARQVIITNWSGTKGEQIERLLELRRLVRSLLVAGGALIALVTLQAGAVMNLVREIDDSYNRPQQYVLVFGIVGTLLVGSVYLPTRSALQTRALDLARSLSEISPLGDAEAIEKALDRRRSLLAAMEADRSLLADLQADLVVLAPLIASAAAITLPGG